MVKHSCQIAVALVAILAVFPQSHVDAFSLGTPTRPFQRTSILLPPSGRSIASQPSIVYRYNCGKSSNTATPHLSSLSSSSKNEEPPIDELFDGRSTFALVGGQSLLILAAALAAKILSTPNNGLGPGISFDNSAIQQGLLFTIPIFTLAFLLDFVEKNSPALQDVTIATQRSVLALLGSTFKPGIAFITSVALGLAAGFGEEMLFRGVLQWELASRFGDTVALGVTSIVFGLLHAVTPLYAIFAALASIYFGWLYQSAGNLAVPIVTHAIYDVGALLWAHWSVTQMTTSEQQEILDWEGPGTSEKIKEL